MTPSIRLVLTPLFLPAMSAGFPVESNAILESVGRNGIVNNWQILQKILSRKIIFFSDLSAPSTEDLSPASTVRTTDLGQDTLKSLILAQISSFTEPPIAIQRLCELLSDDVCANFAKLVFRISRIIASSHYIHESRVTELSLLRRRSSRDSSDSSDYSGISSPRRPKQILQRRYSDTMLTRTLKRRRVEF